MRKSFNVRNPQQGNTKWSESNQSNGDCRFIIFRAVVSLLYIFLHNVLRVACFIDSSCGAQRARKNSIYGRAMQLRQMIINNLFSLILLILRDSGRSKDWNSSSSLFSSRSFRSSFLKSFRKLSKISLRLAICIFSGLRVILKCNQINN